jgi:bacillithiol biosynthesis cysteine-adding enzyme BshC
MSLQLHTTPFAPVPRLDLPALVKARGFAVDSALAPSFLAQDAAASNRDRLLDGALCVTTGQQPGLFTGPLFTVYKALTLVALARELEERLSRPVVPVFWVAGDDHDLAEANHVHVLTVDNTVDRIVVRERPSDEPLIPLYREPLSEGILAALERLRSATPETEFQADIIGWLERHYRPERDYATSFAEAMAELLGPHGLVVMRPTHEAAKRVMAPLLIRALERAGELDRALVAEASRLGSAPVPVGDQATLVMLECEMGRDRLIAENGRFIARRGGNSWTLDELEQIAQDDPRRLSPNVLLRPVVEAALLPTLAYVGGPGELAYLPQCAPAYAALDVRPQAAVPRWSGRIVESRVAKVLEKYGIDAEALARAEGQLEAELVRDDMPPAAQQALTTLRKTLAQEYRALEEAATQIDPTLEKTIQNAANSALKELTHLEKRLVSHLKSRNEIVIQQLAKARVNLFPLGKPQERVFTVAPYLVRYGRGLLDQVLAAAGQWYRSG